MFEDKTGYLGFTFNGHHSSEFGLLVVSGSNRYHQNLYSAFSDTITQVAGKNGGYYFGTQLSTKDFTINCVFDNMNSHMKQKIEQWLYPNKTGWLVYDEMPYKKYYVKISQNIQFDFIPFDEYASKGNFKFQRDIYKGELDINFFSFYEYAVGNEDYELPSFAAGSTITQYAIDSGLLPKSYYSSVDGLLTTEDSHLDEVSTTSGVSLYNAGNGIAEADFYFTLNSSDIGVNNPLEIYNYDDGITYRLYDPTDTIKEKIGLAATIAGTYDIEILGTKKEVWLTYTPTGETTGTKVNIGNCYNHYFPRVYHKKPTDIMLVNQAQVPNTYLSAGSADSWSGEPLFYSYSWADGSNNLSSDNKGDDQKSFEEIQSEWSDYTIVTQSGAYAVNNIINPAVIFFSDPDKQVLQPDELVYLVYPNKFSSNKKLLNFTAKYKNTYI